MTGWIESTVLFGTQQAQLRRAVATVATTVDHCVATAG